MELYWHNLINNLNTFLKSVREEGQEEKLFEGFDIHMGSKSNNSFPVIELIWMTEQKFAINREGDNRREVRMAADILIKYVKDNPAEGQAILYEAQCRFIRAMRYWQEYIGRYTFPGGLKYGVIVQLNSVYSDGELSQPIIPCRFDITLKIKEDSRRGDNYGLDKFYVLEER